MADEPQVPVVNDEELSLDQIRELAMNEQPRDEQGRFVAQQAQQPEAEPEPQPEPEPQVFRREIDLGDGSGKQVFEGTSFEELVDKLADAQLHATRKIRELSKQKKEEPPPPAPPVPSDFTEDEKWLLSQEFLTDPDKAFDKLVEKRLLPKLQPKLEKIEAIERQERANEASDKFVESHPDYYATPKNGEKLVRYLNTWKMDATVENLEKAYQELNESGLLEAKPEAVANTDAESDTRIANSDTVRPVRKVASGLSGKRSAPALVPQGPTEDELYEMPMDKLADLIRKQASQPK